MMAPIYVNYLTHMIGAMMVKLSIMELNAEDQQRLFLSALLLNYDEQAHTRVKENLKDRGTLVVHLWMGYYKAVQQTNTQAAEDQSNEIDKFLARFKQGT